METVEWPVSLVSQGKGHLRIFPLVPRHQTALLQPHHCDPTTGQHGVAKSGQILELRVVPIPV